MKPNRPPRKPLTTLQYLRGDGNPSVSDTASLLAEADVEIARAKRSCKPPGATPPALLAFLDAVYFGLRMCLYEVGFLLVRVVALLVGYGVTAAIIIGLVCLLFLA